MKHTLIIDLFKSYSFTRRAMPHVRSRWYL